MYCELATVRMTEYTQEQALFMVAIAFPRGKIEKWLAAFDLKTQISVKTRMSFQAIPNE